MKRVGVALAQAGVFVLLVLTAPVWIAGLVIFVRRYDDWAA